MGWTVLYIAFGVVALWLLGEVLLQYKARLRWRLLAFVGFLGVVLGVLMPSVPVIGAGAITFATGQTFVTLSFRRGFSTGWALGGSPGESRRRKTESRAASQEPTLEVSDLEYTDAYGGTDTYDGTPPQGVPMHGTPPQGTPEYDAATHVYATEPMPDDTGQYGVYSDSAFPPPDFAPPPPAAAPAAAGYGYDELSGYDQPAYQQPGYDQYAYETTGQQQYAAYSDPYIGAQTYGGDPLGDTGYDPYGTHAGQPAQQDPYSAAYSADTPPGGVWVPQQRAGGDLSGGELPPEEPYPYQPNGYDTGQNYGYDTGQNRGYDTGQNYGYDTGYNQQQPYSY